MDLIIVISNLPKTLVLNDLEESKVCKLVESKESWIIKTKINCEIIRTLSLDTMTKFIIFILFVVSAYTPLLTILLTSSN